MASYISENRQNLKNRHYIRRATADSGWFDFMQRKLLDYVRQYGDHFCMVIYHSDTLDDAYILPYSAVKHLFTNETIEAGRARWSGNIEDGSLSISPGPHVMDIRRYHNAVELLDTAMPVCADLPETPILPNRVPTTVSRILRDSVLVATLKRKYNFCC